MNSLGVDGPSLGSVVLVPGPDNIVSVRVSPVVKCKNDITEILNVLSFVEEGSLPDVVSPWSDNSVACSELLGTVLS